MEIELKRNIAEGTVCTQYQVIKLTDEEIEQVYRARRLFYNMEDIKSKLEDFIGEDEPEDEPVYIDHGIEVSRATLRRVLNDEEWVRNTAERFDNALEDNDSFMESFWLTAEYVIAEELDGEEEE